MTTDPALIELGTDRRLAFAGRPAVLVGRSRDADLPVFDPACSRRQFRVRRAGDDFLLEALSEATPTFCDGARVTDPLTLVPNAVIRAGASAFKFVRGVAEPGADRETVRGSALSDEAEEVPPVPVRGDLVLGRDPGADVRLPHPLVSRRHARVKRHGAGAVVADLGSANGTFVNGKRLTLPVLVRPGDRVQVGPFALEFTGDSLVAAAGGSAPLLIGSGLVRHARAGGPRLLDEVTVAFRPGEFTAVIGPSGCGKSTLLQTLGGRLTPDAGHVTLAGCDLYAGPAARGRVAVVSQREVLPDGLRVADALRFTAALRLPPDTGPAELDRAVASILRTVGLADRADVPVRQLSGGQLKRAGLANELLADPGVVLLDEVTSGLDERADRELMGLFRQIAGTGKTVVCVTHNLSGVADTCHRVVVLAPGGRVAFAGRPADALEYFGIDRLGDVYERLGERAPDEWRAAFRQSPKSFVERKSERTPVPSVAISDPLRDSARRSPRGPVVRHQTPILARRTLKVLLADRPALGVLAGQCVLVAGLLVWVFGDVRRPPGQEALAAADARSLMFVLAVTAFWLGCSTAAKEITREWRLFLAERQANLDPAAYLAAKWGVLGALTAAQVSALYLIVAAGCGLPGDPLWVWGGLTAVGLAGTAAGLAVSAWASSEAVAVALVPVLVIPQLVLSDVFRPLAGPAKAAADVLVTAHRGFTGLRAALPPDLAPFVAPPGVAPGGELLAILVQAGAFAAVAWAALEYRARPDRRAQ